MKQNAKPKEQNNRGLGNQQQEERYNTQLIILKVLFDGQSHQNKELKHSTKLSYNSLNKNLKKMTEIGVIEKSKGVKNGKYAVFYKTSEELFYMTAINMWKEIQDEINKNLELKKDPLLILEEIHLNNEEFFLQLLSQIQNKKTDTVKIKYLTEVMILQNYRYLVNELIRKTLQMRNEINIEKLIDLQYKRQKQKTESEETVKSAILSFPEFMKKYEESQKPPDYSI